MLRSLRMDAGWIIYGNDKGEVAMIVIYVLSLFRKRPLRQLSKTELQKRQKSPDADSWKI
jgi:hypothetical protein